jgi:hypothetical protein
MLRCIVVLKILGPTFLKLRPNAMNSSDQSLKHVFMKFTAYGHLILSHVYNEIQTNNLRVPSA